METLFLLTEILTVVFKNNVYYIRMLCNNFLWLTWPSLLTKDGDDAHASQVISFCPILPTGKRKKLPQIYYLRHCGCTSCK